MDEYIYHKKKETLFYAVCGIIGGFLLFIAPAALFYITTIIITAYFIYHNSDKKERTFILHLFFSALFLRWVFIVITHFLSSYYGLGPKLDLFPGMEGGALVGDDGAIHRGSWALAKMISGIQLSAKEAKNLFSFREFGWSLHYWVLGFFYYLFGYVPILGKGINALFGVLTGITVYFTAKELFGLRAAKLSYILTVFYPTLFLWSIVNLKDTILIFLLTFAAYSYVMFFKGKRIKYLFLLTGAFFLINYYRLGILPLLIFSTFVSFIVSISWKNKKIGIFIALLACFLSGYFFYHHYRDCIKSIPQKIIVEKFIAIQRGCVDSGGTIYKIYPERFYKSQGYKAESISAKEMAVSLLKGVFSVLFKPFPREIDKKSKLFYYPLSMFWNTLFLFFVLGLLVSIRYKFKQNVFLISTYITILVFLSLIEGNVGTVLRHRDMITPIYIIFSSFGIVRML